MSVVPNSAGLRLLVEELLRTMAGYYRSHLNFLRTGQDNGPRRYATDLSAESSPYSANCLYITELRTTDVVTRDKCLPSWASSGLYLDTIVNTIGLYTSPDCDGNLLSYVHGSIPNKTLSIPTFMLCTLAGPVLYFKNITCEESHAPFHTLSLPIFNYTNIRIIDTCDLATSDSVFVC